MPIFIHTEQHCPVCKEVLNAVDIRPQEDDTTPVPQAGDLTICVHCHAVLIINYVHIPRRLTDAEWTALAHDDEAIAGLLATLEKIKDGSWREEVGYA